jgi:hypothetical protein
MWRVDRSSRLGFGVRHRIMGGFAPLNLDAGGQKGEWGGVKRWGHDGDISVVQARAGVGWQATDHGCGVHPCVGDQ